MIKTYMEPSQPIAPRRLLVPLGIGLILCLFGDATLYTVLPKSDILAEAGITLGMVGIVLGVNRLVRLISNGPAGWLYDRMPRRGLMVGSLFIGLLSTILYALSQGNALMLTGRILWGIAWSGIWIGTTSMTLDISHATNRGFINGQLQVWYFLGVGVCSLLSGLMTDLVGYRGTLWISAGLGLLAALTWLVFLPETRPVVTQAVKEVRHKPPRRLPWKLAASLTLPYFSLKIIFDGVLAASTILWLQQFVDGGMSLGHWFLPVATLTGIFTALRMVVSIFSPPWIGRLSDHLRRRWAVLAGVLVLGVAGLAGMSMPNFTISIAGGLVAAVTAGAIPLLVPAIVGDRVSQDQHGRTLGFIFSWGDLGSGLGPILGLALIPRIGIGATYQLCAALLAVAGIQAIWLAGRESQLPIEQDAAVSRPG